MRLFISHSSRDVKIAGLLIDLLRFSLNLRSEEIRCTTVEGYRLPGGASTEEVLRREVHDAQLFIALLTPDSSDSPWVLFELGARWGTGKKLIPLLASGASSEHLIGPLSGLNALNCSVPDQVHQLLEEAAKHLSLTPSAPSTYQKALTALVSASSTAQEPSGSLTAAARDPKSTNALAHAVAQVLRVLASDEVDGDKEIRVSSLPRLLSMSAVKVEVLIERLKRDGLVGPLSGSEHFVGLTPDGARYVVENGLV